MHPYIPHLLTDIADAHRSQTEILPVATLQQSFEEEMEEIERWIAGEEAPHTFGYWCGLEPSQFPPPEQLSNDDMAMVCKAFDRMMFSWNLSIDLPEKFPDDLKYSFRVNTLNEKTAIVNAGIMHFDYCTGYAPDCIFKAYCPCLEIWNQSVEDDTDNTAGLPADKQPNEKPDRKAFNDPDDGPEDLPF